MLFELVVAGFGGQGILFLGDAIARSALREGRFVTYLPTYGVAMRGGTANCIVTISDDEIGSPLLDHAHAAIVLNEQSLVRFQPIVRPGGLLIANSSLIDPSAFNRPGEVRIVWIPATELARDSAGTERAANIVALGAFVQASQIVQIATVEAILREGVPVRRQAMIEKNLAALRAGRNTFAAEQNEP